jgi:hypothetical protein
MLFLRSTMLRYHRAPIMETSRDYKHTLSTTVVSVFPRSFPRNLRSPRLRLHFYFNIRFARRPSIPTAFPYLGLPIRIRIRILVSLYARSTIYRFALHIPEFDLRSCIWILHLILGV